MDFCLTDLSSLPELEQSRIEPLGMGIGALLAELRDARFASVQIPQQISRRLSRLFGANAEGQLSLALASNSTLVLRNYALHTDTAVFAPLDLLAQGVRPGSWPELDELGQHTPLPMELGLLWLRDRTPSVAALQLATRVR